MGPDSRKRENLFSPCQLRLKGFGQLGQPPNMQTSIEFFTLLPSRVDFPLSIPTLCYRRALTIYKGDALTKLLPVFLGLFFP